MLFFYSKIYNTLVGLLPYSENVTYKYLPRMANYNVQIYAILAYSICV